MANKKMEKEKYAALKKLKREAKNKQIKEEQAMKIKLSDKILRLFINTMGRR